MHWLRWWRHGTTGPPERTRRTVSPHEHKECEVCGKVFLSERPTHTTCSKKCMGVARHLTTLGWEVTDPIRWRNNKRSYVWARNLASTQAKAREWHWKQVSTLPPGLVEAPHQQWEVDTSRRDEGSVMARLIDQYGIILDWHYVQTGIMRMKGFEIPSLRGTNGRGQYKEHLYGDLIVFGNSPRLFLPDYPIASKAGWVDCEKMDIWQRSGYDEKMSRSLRCLRGKVNRETILSKGEKRNWRIEAIYALCGSEGPRCQIPDCPVTDVTVLAIDHVNNDGYLEKGRNAVQRYRDIANGAPHVQERFQVLCPTHNWEKRLHALSINHVP